MSTVWPRWFRNLTANQRKVSLMIGLVGVGLLLWGRLLFKDVPRTALADPTDQAAASPAAPEARRAGRPVVRVVLSPRLERDLFALDARYYPARRGNPASIEAVTPPAPDKFAPQTTDVQQQVLDARHGLVLQTTILGDRPRAMINGQVMSPGDKIGGFTLRKVLPRGVILEMNGIEVRLEM
jgi:hypothetical protein